MSVLTVDHNFGADGVSKKSNVPLSIEYMFFATGDFGGGTLSLEASPDDGVTWFTVEQLSKPGRLIRYLVSGERVQFCLSGANTPNVNVGLRQ